MTIEQIDKIDERVRSKQIEIEERSKIKNVINFEMIRCDRNLSFSFGFQETKVEKIPEVNVPKPADLGKPALSTDDLQELIQDLSAPDPSTEVKQPVIREIIRQPSPVKIVLPKAPIQIKKKSAVVRMPSSWLPSKTSPKVGKKEAVILSPGFPPSLAGQSLLKGSFKIPKINKTSPLTSPTSSSSSYSSDGNEASKPNIKLQNIDIFKPLKRPQKWDDQPKVKTEDPSRDAIEKLKIIRSPSVDKKNVFTIQKSPEKNETEEANDRPSPRIRVRNPKELLVAKEWSPEKNALSSSTRTFYHADDSKDELMEPKKESEEVVNSPSRSTKRKQSNLEERRNKELRRLHENIVKDETPLPSRRSCTMKRSSTVYRDSPVQSNDGSADDQEQPIVKRLKSETKDDNALTSKSSPAAQNKSDKTASLTKPHVKRDLRSEETQKPSPIRKRMIVPGQSLARSEIPHRALEKRYTRNSIVIAKNEENKSVKKLKSNTETLPASTNIDLKNCSINLPAVTTDKPIKFPTEKKSNTKIFGFQVAKKSTSQRQEVLAQLKSRKSSTSLLKKSKPGRNSPKETIHDDNEWEDLEEDDASIADEESDEKMSLHEDEPKLPKVTTFIYKNIANIAFTYCRSGAIFKCLLEGCRFQTLQKHSFVKHLEDRHKSVTWNGYCNVCVKTVLPTTTGHSIINEFIHMMEEHLQKENVLKETLPEVPDNPEHDSESSADSPTPDIDAELMRGIDSILNELLPDEMLEDINIEKKPNALPVKAPLTQAKAQYNNFSLPQTSTTIPMHLPLRPPASVPTLVSASASTLVPAPTVVISKNLIGRVINLQNAKKFKLTPGAFKIQPSPLSQNIQLTSTQPIPSDRIMKYVIKKPIIIPELAMKPALKVTPTVQPAVIEASKQQFEPLGKESDIETITVNRIKEPSLVKNEELYHTALRPWLLKHTKKSLQAANEMLSSVALIATYKCLGMGCSFFTIDANIFRRHLNYHEKFTKVDKANFLSCAYCNFVGLDQPDELLDHVTKEHRFDKYQCHYCFYRSCVDFNVLTHQNNFHKMKPRSILQIESREIRDYQVELEQVKKRRIEVVPPIVCVCK